MRDLFRSYPHDPSGSIVDAPEDVHSACRGRVKQQPPCSQSQAPVAVCVSGRWS
jgi:hypothetical protein